MATRDVKADFNLDELFATLREQPEQLEGFYSTTEMANMMDRSEGWILRQLKQAKARGQLETMHVSTETVDGRKARKPVYRLTMKED